MAWDIWSVGLDLQNNVLKEEYQALWHIMNKIYELSEEEASRSAHLIALNELNCYAEKLLKDEQKILESTSSAEHQANKKRQLKLLTQLANHTEDFKASNKNCLDPSFFRFLQTWFETYTYRSERKFAHAVPFSTRPAGKHR